MIFNQIPKILHLQGQLYHASIGLLIEQPYFGTLLSDLLKVTDATEARSLEIGFEDPVFVLRLNPEYWREKLPTPEAQMGALLHQLLHLFFGHLFLAADFPDRFAFDVAADMQANEYNHPQWLPVNAVRLGELADFPLEANQTVFHYYDRVQSLWTDGGRQYPLSYSKLQQWHEQREWLFESHNGWFLPKAIRRVDKELARLAARSLILQAAAAAGEKALGQLPLPLRLELEKEPEPRPAIHWRKLLRQFGRSSRSTLLKETIHRPSKRYRTTPGIRVRRRQRLLLGVDTSGSVSREEQAAFFSEIDFLARTGAELTLVEFDSEVQHVSKYKGRRPAFLLGGGGTNFIPVLEYANRSGPWDGVILFTDGFAPTPRLDLRFPLLWAITSQGLPTATPMFRALPGRKLKLREGSEKNANFGA